MSQSWVDLPSEEWERYILNAEERAADSAGGLIKGVISAVVIEGTALSVLVVALWALGGRWAA